MLLFRDCLRATSHQFVNLSKGTTIDGNATPEVTEATVDVGMKGKKSKAQRSMVPSQLGGPPRSNERDMCMDPGAEGGDDVSRWLERVRKAGQVFDIALESEGKSGLGLAKGKMITSAGCRVRLRTQKAGDVEGLRRKGEERKGKERMVGDPETTK